MVSEVKIHRIEKGNAKFAFAIIGTALEQRKILISDEKEFSDEQEKFNRIGISQSLSIACITVHCVEFRNRRQQLRGHRGKRNIYVH